LFLFSLASAIRNWGEGTTGWLAIRELKFPATPTLNVEVMTPKIQKVIVTKDLEDCHLSCIHEDYFVKFDLA
jgi:hypothetical protein